MSSGKHISHIIDDVKGLCKKGLFLDALRLGSKHWGEIKQWQGVEQVLLAIKISFHLGGDRQSDYFLLRAYRSHPTNLELIDRLLFYYLYKIGPILCQEKLHSIEAKLSPDGSEIPEFFLFKSVLYRELKHFTLAETYFEKSKQAGITPDYLPSLACRLLLEQDADEQALIMAEENFAAFASIGNLRTYMSAIQKVEDLGAGLSLLISNVGQFQSSSLYLQMAGMAASELDWDSCENAINQYEKIAQFEDKYEQQRLSSYKAQLAIHKGEYEKASEFLTHTKTPYWQMVLENLQAVPKDANIKILKVPFYRQEHLTCAPTTMAAMAAYWGKDFSSKDIADQICYSGTPDTEERQWLRDNNFHFVEFDLNQEYLFQLIDADIPFGLVTTSGFTAHLQAVIGYNKFVGTMYMMDPSNSGMQEMLIKQGLESEAFNGPRCLAFVPMEQKHKLDDFKPFDHEMYIKWDEYAVAKNNNDSETMKSIVEQMKQMASEHRLYIKAARDYALWLRDYKNVQQFNEMLLERYPNESILLNSQYFCLRDLGLREQALDSLEQYLDKHHNVSLACVLLGEIYDTNERPKTVEKLIRIIKRYGSYLEDAHYSLANYYWDSKQRKKAKDAYLYAHCLDETNDIYLESFFKASRFFNEESQAIAFLKQRYKKYAKRSALPAISLFNAYELSNEEHKGFEYLEHAMEHHQHDKTIATVLGKKLIAFGQFTKFEDYQTQIKARLTKPEFEDLQAQLQLKKGHLEQARAYYEKQFTKHPFNSDYAESYFGLLKKMECTDDLDNCVNALYEEHSEHAIAQDYVITWHSDEKLQQKVLIDAVKARPDNAWLRRQLIDKYLRFAQKDEALALANETVKILGSDAHNFAYLARVHKQLGQFDKAIENAKIALSMNVDNDLAFHCLLQASIKKEQKLEHLDFVLAQTKEQVSFGDGVWNYWFEAQYIVPEPSLREFVGYVLNKLSHLWYSYMIAAFFHKHIGDIDKAIELALEGTQKFPFTPRLFKELGLLYELNNQDDEAVNALNEALLINPAWSDVAKHLADFYEKRGQYDKAIEVISNTIKHTNDDGILYGYLADFYLQSSDNDNALKALYKAVEFNTEYDWAWAKIGQIAQEKQQENLAYEHAQKLAHKYPFLGQVWCNLANACNDRDEKRAHIQKALAVNPMNSNAYITLAYYHCDVGEYQQALAVFKDTPWEAHLPFELISVQAEIFAQVGQLENAVDSLTRILYSQAGHSKLWDKLYHYLYKLDRQKAIVEACYKQIELNKHDASSLCVASENLLRAGDKTDQKKAKKYLTRAYELAPHNQYTVLTYVDFLMSEKEFELALETMTRFKAFSNSPFVIAREVNCFINLDKIENAQASFELVLDNPDSEYWCIDTPVTQFIKHKKFARVNAILEQRLAQLSEVQAYVWADKNLEVKGKSFYRELLSKVRETSNDLLQQGVIRALYEYWNDNDYKPDFAVIKEFETTACQSNSIFEQLALLLLRNGKYQTLVSMFEQAASVSYSMFTYYQVRAAYQILGRWDEAAEVIKEGWTRPVDGTVHNMRLWYCYELWRNGQVVSDEELDLIDLNELVDAEQYVFATLKVPSLLGDNDLESSLDAITPELRRCQRMSSSIGGNFFVEHARRLLKERLVARISSTGFIASAIIKWKLGNRF